MVCTRNDCSNKGRNRYLQVPTYKYLSRYYLLSFDTNLIKSASNFRLNNIAVANGYAIIEIKIGSDLNCSLPGESRQRRLHR